MGKAYKNFWSLNIDEAIAIGLLRAGTKKNVEIFIPMNAQMKGIDLVCINIKTGKSLTIQVKGSRAYEPEGERDRVKERVRKIGGNTSDGSSTFFSLKKPDVTSAIADYFAFLGSVIITHQNAGRRSIEPHILLIPARDMKRLVNKYKKAPQGMYRFYFWINPKETTAFDWRDKPYMVNEYLDKKGFERLNRDLK